MQIIRYEWDGAARYGVLEEEVIHEWEGSPFGEHRNTGVTRRLGAVHILPPSQPSKVVAVGLNYRDHAEEFGEPIPAEPKIFIKPSTAVIAHGEDIVIPAMSQRVDYEAELALVIAKRCKNVSPGDAADYILGYTCLNDVTARDIQSRDGQWTRAKGFDTFAPVGPVVVTDADPSALDVRLLHNGVVKQQSNTRHFIFTVPELVSFISRVMTLLPGDIITTGTPSGVGPLSPGDTVSVDIAGVGTLTNGVVHA